MRVVFMGTPSAAVPALRTTADTFSIAGVYTRPDKAHGRGLHVGSSPVKAAAEELGLPVLQPRRLRDEAESLRGLEPDVVLVVAYGAILPADVLAVPKLGCVNVHFSLLPRWRGAAPVERAILAGDERTGVTTMLMDQGLDTGPMLLQVPDDIRPEDTSGSLRARLAEIGAEAAVRTLQGLEQGQIEPTPQPEEGATYASKIEPAEAELDLSSTAEELTRKVRALNPSPGTFIWFRGKRLKVWRAGVKRFEDDPGPLDVDAADGHLRLLEVQPEGKKRMSGEDFARGYRPEAEDFRPAV